VTTSGQVLTQHLEYFPGGELWREEDGTALSQVAAVEHATTFTGKELDPSGYYYFGARYYEPQLQSWLSPDPMLQTYMRGRPNQGIFGPKNLALYSYAWNNPAGLRDSDGRFPIYGGGEIPNLATHQAITSRALTPFVSQHVLDTITRANVAVDKHQHDDDQYMHAMRSVLETPEQAKARTARFIEQHLNKAAEYIKAGKYDKGWEEFGTATHPVQDSHATAHHTKDGDPTTYAPGNKTQHIKTDAAERIDQPPAQGAVAGTRDLLQTLEKKVKTGSGDKGFYNWENALMSGAQ
jgi:RHS repeat-associated protein